MRSASPPRPARSTTSVSITSSSAQAWWRGRPQLARLWDDEAALARVYRRPLFSTARLRDIRLLPTEYVFTTTRPAGRGQFARGGRHPRRHHQPPDARPVRRLGEGRAHPVARYERYLAQRSAGYMQLESGAPDGAAAPAPWAHLTGYDKIALHTIGGLCTTPTPSFRDCSEPRQHPGTGRRRCDRGAVHRDRQRPAGAARGRSAAAGARPGVMGEDLQRATIEAVRTGTREAMVAALALNPLVPSQAAARRLVEVLCL